MAKDPNHYHAFYATTAYPISLMFDTQKYPYSIVAFRKAVSRAIDRNRSRSSASTATRRHRCNRAARAVPGVARQDRGGQGEGARQLRPDRGEEAAHRRRLHLQGQRPLRPEGQPRQVRHPRDLGLVGLGRLAPDHHEEPAGHRHRREREARARLGLLVPERDEHEGRDAALADRRDRARPSATSSTTCTRTRTSRRARTPSTRATSPTTRTRRRRRCSISGRRRSTSPSRSRCGAAPEPLARPAADRAAVHRPAVVDVLDQVLPLLPDAEELLHAIRSSTRSPTTSSRSPASARAASRSRTAPSSSPLRRRWAGSARPAHRRQSDRTRACAISFDASASTPSLSGAR